MYISPTNTSLNTTNYIKAKYKELDSNIYSRAIEVAIQYFEGTTTLQHCNLYRPYLEYIISDIDPRYIQFTETGGSLTTKELVIHTLQLTGHFNYVYH